MRHTALTYEVKEADLAGEIKSLSTELLGQLAQFQTEQGRLQRQLDAVESKMQRPAGGGFEAKSIGTQVFEHENVRRFVNDGGRGKCIVKISDFSTKSTIDSATVGSGTSGVLMPERSAAIVGIQFRRLFLRDLLRARKTTSNAVDYVKVDSFTNATSPQTETESKAEAELTFTTVSAPVRTLAHWLPASRQVLDDMAGLQDSIESHLVYGLKLKEEQEILAGSGAGLHLNGLITQATAFNTSLLTPSAGWNTLDVIARALAQAELADYSADFIVLNPSDFWTMALTKDENGQYLFGKPSEATVPRLWGRPISVTNNIAAGTFVVGASNSAAVFDRQEVLVEISTEHADFFTRNMVAIRCESRLALVCYRPASFIYGSLSSSPA